jgi:hypothetical protein
MFGSSPTWPRSTQRTSRTSWRNERRRRQTSHAPEPHCRSAASRERELSLGSDRGAWLGRGPGEALLLLGKGAARARPSARPLAAQSDDQQQCGGSSDQKSRGCSLEAQALARVSVAGAKSAGCTLLPGVKSPADAAASSGVRSQAGQIISGQTGRPTNTTMPLSTCVL